MKLTKMIEIYMDYTNDECKPYREVIDAIAHGQTNICTCCTDFFSFSYLDAGYDVKVIWAKDDQTIQMSKLLDPEYSKTWTNKEIRKVHNLHKMLIAGVFDPERVSKSDRNESKKNEIRGRLHENGHSWKDKLPLIQTEIVKDPGYTIEQVDELFDVLTLKIDGVEEYFGKYYVPDSFELLIGWFRSAKDLWARFKESIMQSANMYFVVLGHDNPTSHQIINEIGKRLAYSNNYFEKDQNLQYLFSIGEVESLLKKYLPERNDYIKKVQITGSCTKPDDDDSTLHGFLGKPD
jgi:hypothetical protein